MRKHEMIAVLEDNQKIDLGIPITWSANAKDIHIDPSDYAWDYRENKLAGMPLNLYKGYALFLEQSNKQLLNRIYELNQDLDDAKRNSAEASR